MLAGRSRRSSFASVQTQIIDSGGSHCDHSAIIFVQFSFQLQQMHKQTIYLEKLLRPLEWQNRKKKRKIRSDLFDRISLDPWKTNRKLTSSTGGTKLKLAETSGLVDLDRHWGPKVTIVTERMWSHLSCNVK